MTLCSRLVGASALRPWHGELSLVTPRGGADNSHYFPAASDSGGGPRQPELDGGPLAHFALDPHGASGLSSKTVDHRQPETGTTPDFLGCEKRFESMGKRRLVHTRSGITD